MTNKIQATSADVVKEEAEIVLAEPREEIDIQIATAKRYPRDIKAFMKTAASMACYNEEMAAGCFYVLPKGGKRIEGPSVRLAEICASAYKNLRFGAKPIGETPDRKSVVAEGFCYDMENNTASAIQVTRRIVDRHGSRYRDDVIETTKLAACAIAKRNAIFNVIPAMYVNLIYNEAKRLAVGDATSLVDRRQRMVDYFQKLGVDQERLLAKLGKPSIENVDLGDIELLIGLSTSIKEGAATVEDVFPVKSEGDEPKDLKEKLKAKTAKQDERQPGEDDE